MAVGEERCGAVHLAHRGAAGHDRLVEAGGLQGECGKCVNFYVPGNITSKGFQVSCPVYSTTSNTALAFLRPAKRCEAPTHVHTCIVTSGSLVLKRASSHAASVTAPAVSATAARGMARPVLGEERGGVHRGQNGVNAVSPTAARGMARPVRVAGGGYTGSKTA